MNIVHPYLIVKFTLDKYQHHSLITWPGLVTARSHILERRFYLALSVVSSNFVRSLSGHVLGNTSPVTVIAIVCICATCLFYA